MKFKQKIAMFMILAAIQIPCTSYAAEEDKELALIAAEQEGEDEQLGEINPALTESISTKPTQETEKDKKERKKKLNQMRKEKEKENERKLKESKNQNKREKRRREKTIIIDPDKPSKVETSKVEPPKVEPPKVEPPKVEPSPVENPVQYTPPTQPTRNFQATNLSNPSNTYASFAEAARAVHFIPLYMPTKSGYEITAIFVENGVAEIRYGRKWEPTISLTVRTYRRSDGEELKDISGVTGVKWRVDNSTGTTIYLAKISDKQQVAAWAVGHYTFSARSENLSFASFHSLVADELVELSTHYYLDL